MFQYAIDCIQAEIDGVTSNHFSSDTNNTINDESWASFEKNEDSRLLSSKKLKPSLIDELDDRIVKVRDYISKLDN